MDKEEIRMSYSSMSEIRSCEMKYAHRKIFFSEVDSDVEDSDLALRVGGCFHEVLENCNHKYFTATLDEILPVFDKYEIDEPELRGMLYGMWSAYSRLHIKSGLEVVGCEDEIGTDKIVGAIDATMVDPHGYWFIVDLKTTARYDGNLLARLKKDIQLNLYAYFRRQLVDKYQLDPSKFAGVIYRVTEKSKLKMRTSEDEFDFAKRVGESVGSYDIFIPYEELEPEEAYQAVIDAQKKAMSFKYEGVEPTKNYKSCFDWWRPCKYFSKCYGYLHSESTNHFQVRTEKQMTPYVVRDATDIKLEELGL